ncbi:hypothetical protein [Streptomyces sp. NPDC050121]|uniref:hypothetical protein n=1 Tax=Streptomyces sp. NPDC050121 TaxID=3365601 RepID=UPI0037AB8374
MQFHITDEELRATLHEVELSAAAMRSQLEAEQGSGPSSSVAEVNRLLKAMRDTELALRDGTIYALYDPRTVEVRYVGETMTPLRVRLSGHRSKVERPVGQWWAELKEQGLEPLVDDLRYVPAKFRRTYEQQTIIHYTWLGFDLLNRSTADDDAVAYRWLQKRHGYPAEPEASTPGWWWDEAAGDWHWMPPEWPVWHSMRQWRYRVRGAHCPECSARPGQACTGMRQSAASLSEGRSNHLGRIAARVRHEGGWETWAARRWTAGRRRSWRGASAPCPAVC